MLCDDCLHAAICENITQGNCEWYLSEKELKEKWIPVSERLPIRNGVYIVTRIIEGTRITDASYFDGQNTWHRDVGVNHGRPYLNDVIAWQPRPEPYKEGGADMRKPNCVTCDHFGKCEKCEKGDEE